MSALARPLPDGHDSLVLQMFWEHPLVFLTFCNSDWYTYKVAVGDSSFTGNLGSHISSLLSYLILSTRSHIQG